MHAGRGRVACIVLLFLFGLAFPACAKPLTFGVLAHRGENNARSRWQATAEYLTEKLHEEVSLVPLTLEGMQAALAAGRLDFLLTNPGHYVATAAEFPLSPLATLQRNRSEGDDRPNKFGSVIFTRADRDDIHALGDLKGKTFGAVAPDAFGGYQIAADTLMYNGLNPEQDFQAINFLGFPQDRIVRAVVDGDVDFGTVRTGIIEAMVAEDRLRMNQIKVLNPHIIDGFDYKLSTDLFPEWTFAATTQVSPGLKRKAAIALLSMSPADPAALAGNYGGWNTPMNDKDVRSVLDTLAGHPGPPMQQPSANLTFWLTLAALTGFIAFLLGRFRLPRQAHAPLGSALAGDDARLAALTRREHQVLDLIVRGRTNKEMARQLGISPKTVEFHRGHVMKKLKADTVADLVRIALECGQGMPHRQT